MKEIFTNELLSILALLSCSSNIMQLVFYQSTKKRMEAKAKSLALDVSKKEIKIQEADRESILKQLDDMMSRLISTQTEVQNSLLEVATLRAKLIMKDQETQDLMCLAFSLAPEVLTNGRAHLAVLTNYHRENMCLDNLSFGI